MAQERISMPSSGGGIVRYFDEYKSKITIKPGYVVVLVFVVLILSLILHAFGQKLLGY